MLKHKTSPLELLNEKKMCRFESITLTTDDLYRIQQNANHKAHEFTIIVLGGSRTGKTSLVRRFVMGVFSRKYKRSVGIKQYQYKCTIPIQLRERTLADTNADDQVHSGSYHSIQLTADSTIFDSSDDELEQLFIYFVCFDNNHNDNNNNTYTYMYMYVYMYMYYYYCDYYHHYFYLYCICIRT
ncbi:hypothetical protein RFI_13745 [Reticulomyxa filosa]|uniref:Uncharacterized protein n=1 Tax=Reticulomyxa filosa TaxID=46433 RepID=X6NDN2_RETFI|nr:hypothetical protein RFI_13745 [Reticulomyxa filosa]|eukprot:ETO23437.1 hypothetical protein RFI_13745 [Reticulomyxa filosa]